jgi:hypothetical protein
VSGKVVQIERGVVTADLGHAARPGSAGLVGALLLEPNDEWAIDVVGGHVGAPDRVHAAEVTTTLAPELRCRRASDIGSGVGQRPGLRVSGNIGRKSARRTITMPSYVLSCNRCRSPMTIPSACASTAHSRIRLSGSSCSTPSGVVVELLAQRARRFGEDGGRGRALARPGCRPRSTLAADTITSVTEAGHDVPIGSLRVITRSGWFAARPSGTLEKAFEGGAAG